MTDARDCSATLIGPLASRLLTGSETAGRVLAVFAPVVYVEVDEQLLALARTGTDPGPITLVSTLPENADFRETGIFEGDAVRLGCGGISIAGKLALSTRKAREWAPQPWPGDFQACRLFRGLDMLRRRLSENVAAAGLGWYLSPVGPVPQDPVLRAAEKPLAAARNWLESRQPDLEWARQLIGLGPGLTPSGDDVLGGLMIALHAIGRPDGAAKVWAEVTKQANLECNPISRALLKSAAEGLGSGSLHAAIADVLAGRDAGAGLDGLARTGHSSGWDALVGATMVLEAEAARAGEPVI